MFDDHVTMFFVEIGAETEQQCAGLQAAFPVTSIYLRFLFAEHRIDLAWLSNGTERVWRKRYSWAGKGLTSKIQRRSGRETEKPKETLP